MSTINKHGLSRVIPAETKLLIRQKSKFGCVICRLAIFTYEHINPVFVEAKEHDAENMCILCPNHQADATSGVLPKIEIAKAYKRVQADTNTIEPSRNGFFDLFGSKTIIQIGASLFTGFTSIINVDGNNFLSFKKNTDTGSGFQISGKFLDDTGNELFRIENNEWVGNSKNWDINIVGTKLTIRRQKGDILFSVKKYPDLNKIDITHLNMWALPFHIKTEKDKLLVGQHDLHNKQYVYYGLNGSYLGGDCALYLDSTKNNVLAVGSWVAKGGETYIEGTGICIGRGSVRTLTKEISVFASNNCPILINIPRKKEKNYSYLYMGY